MEAFDLEKMNIVIVGHVDHGKSTVIGRLLADTGSLPKGKLEQVRDYCERNSMPFEYAFLIDALKDERRQNITIDSARVFFKSPKRHYIIIDAPGHIEFVKNMVTGAARAEAALLVIDAQEGVQENSRRHGNLLSLLGIRQLIVLINKMDLVGFDQARFEEIRREYAGFLDQVGLKPDHFIPVSARLGDNITVRAALAYPPPVPACTSDAGTRAPQVQAGQANTGGMPVRDGSQPGQNMPWYSGPTTLEALDAFYKEKPLTDLPFRMPVQDVYRFTQFGDNRRIIAGTVGSGRIQVNDEVAFYPSGKRSIVQSIESMDNSGQTELVSGQASGFTLSQQIYVKRGDIAVRFAETPPHVAKRLRVSLFWLGKEPFVPHKTYVIKLGTARSRFQIEEILRVVNTSSLENNAGREQVGQHEVAECILSLERAIAFDYADELPETGRFVIVDGYEIRGGGIVLEGLPDAESGARETVFQRNIHWILSDVTEEERSERYKQRACLTIITGQQGIGRKRLARSLESHLFRSGTTVYYLGMGSVIYGVDADIRGHSDIKNRHEHVRRIAEIANIFLDAGMILIVTAVELTQADLELFQTIVDPTKIVTIWVGDPVSTDIQHQLELKGNQPPEQSLPRILELLKNNGFIGGFFDSAG